jgi:hypothetical protein
MLGFIPRITAVLLVAGATVLAPIAADERPFTTSGSGHVDGSDLFGPGSEAIHLGRTSLIVNVELVDFLRLGVFLSSGGRLESANGDFLNFAFEEEFYYFDRTTGIISVPMRFTGGSGRFQDATGNTQATFVFDSNYDQFHFFISGSIDY